MNTDNINFSNYNHIINELGAKKKLTGNESKMLSRALTLEKIISDCRNDYDDEDYDDE